MRSVLRQLELRELSQGAQKYLTKHTERRVTHVVLLGHEVGHGSGVSKTLLPARPRVGTLGMYIAAPLELG